MAEGEDALVPNVLSNEDIVLIPEEIRKKVITHVSKLSEELSISTALLSSTKSTLGKRVEELEKQLSQTTEEHNHDKEQLETTQRELAEVQAKATEAHTELTKLRQTVERLELETSQFRHQRDAAAEERDNYLTMVERRNTELEHLQEDLKSMSSQLHAAVQSKCEALAKVDEVHALKFSLEFKEKRLNQEHDLLKNQIQSLNEDLNRHSTELANLRRDNTSRLITLDSQLSQKTDELRLSLDTNENLTKTNVALNTKIEHLTRKVMDQRDEEMKMRDSYNQELQAQRKLSQLYKKMSDDAESKTKELETAVEELQKLLQGASQQYGELETKLKEKELLHAEELDKKRECIELLKKELTNANELVKAVKRESLEQVMEDLSPAAAAASRLIKSGMTLTQIYTQYVEVAEELLQEKEENKRVNHYISSILEEIENKAPLLRQQRLDYEVALENVKVLTNQMNSFVLENNNLRAEADEAKKSAGHHSRENKRLREELADLAHQVCFLLKEVEAARSGFTNRHSVSSESLLSEGSLDSSKVISQKLVLFSNVEELQANNQKLLAVVRDLSSSQEEMEKVNAEFNPQDLLAKLQQYAEEAAEMQEAQERHAKMMEELLRQRDTYQTLYQQLLDARTEETGPASERGSIVQSPTKASSPATPKSLTGVQQTDKDGLIRELEIKLEENLKAQKEIQEEHASYRQERQTNDRQLQEQIESMRTELRELRLNNGKLVMQAEYSEARFKTLHANSNSYKQQIAALEKKNHCYSETIIKHEQSLMYLKNETLDAQTKLSRAEVALENLRQEYRLVKDSESRLVRERELSHREQTSQSMLMSNLDSIKASIERAEEEGRIRLESRLDEAVRECNALRRRLQEEQDRFRELRNNLERKMEIAAKSLGEEQELAKRAKDELNELKQELAAKENKVQELEKRVKELLSPPVPLKRTETTEEVMARRLKELDKNYNDVQAKLKTAQQQLTIAKQNVKQYCDISEGVERQLREVTANSDNYKATTEKKIVELQTSEGNLKKRVAELEAHLNKLSTGTSLSASQLTAQLEAVRKDLAGKVEELAQVQKDLTIARGDLDNLSSSVQAAESKYAREVVLHSNDIQALDTLKEEVSKLSDEVLELRAARQQSETALSVGRSSWEEREQLIKAEVVECQQRVKDLDAQNALLHNQIEELSSQIAVLHSGPSQPSAEGNVSINKSFDTSLTEDEVNSANQLLQIIKYLRREKDIAISRLEVLRTENIRLLGQQEYSKKQLEEARKSLSSERESTEVSAVTAAKHAELLRKLETLNAIMDSNRILRGERDGLQAQVNALTEQLHKLESELQPLKEKSQDLIAKTEALDAENLALRGEAGRLRQRNNFLVERSNKASPEDWRKLQQERENLVRMLGAEREAHQKLQEEAKGLRQEKARLEESLTSCQRLHQEEVKKIKEELNNVQQRCNQVQQELSDTKNIFSRRNDELAKITESLGANEASLSDLRNKEIQLRKIAKRYKTQSEELTKTVEDNKQKMEELEKAVAEANAAASASSNEIPLDVQEGLREEGRQQVDQRIKEQDSRHSNEVRELTGQVTSTREITESLRREHEQLKASANEKEGRLKVGLSSARQKIAQLTEEKNGVVRQLQELQTRISNFEQAKDESTVRMNALKSQYDARASRLEKENADLRNEKQQEKDRLIREIELLNQRMNQTQRQRYNAAQHLGKPSTSSGPVEKSTTDPPTANIKPMAGPSSSASKQPKQPQPSQQAVTPWPGRGETPFASIRPMSMQCSRTVAVMPTSLTINQSTSSQSSAMLVPPQQQLVHTTGSSSGSGTIAVTSGPEALSSSPTSSHTDYMPATSSAGVRQVIVQPTQQQVAMLQPEPAAESTQDMESITDEEEDEDAEAQQISAATQSQTTQQQAVALILPRIEQQTTTTQTTQTQPQQVVEQSAGSSQASSSQASSSNTVTTTQAGLKRVRDVEGDSSTGRGLEEETSVVPQIKRVRVLGSGSQDQPFKSAASESGLEVEYQVPTSSQRDQEDEIVVIDSDDDDDEECGDEVIPDDGGGVIEEPDDDAEFEEEGEADNGGGYGMEDYDRDEQDLAEYDAEGPDIDENTPEDNEVDIADDSNEVPNQSESVIMDSSGSSVEVIHPPQQRHPEATSSNAAGSATDSNNAGVGTTQQSFSPFGSRGRSVPPLSRQQQQLLLTPQSYEDQGDDSIVPSTPTLFVPRRTDGFGEAVSSPQVPQQGRFTFSDTNPPTTRSGIAQVLSEGMDDTRMDLTQLEEGTGRSVPTTPLLPQVLVFSVEAPVEMSSEIGQSVSEVSDQVPSSAIPAITITAASEDIERVTGDTSSFTTEHLPSGSVLDIDDQSTIQESTSSANLGASSDSIIEHSTEGDGVSSEGEKSQPVKTEDEGREAVASERPSASSVVIRGNSKARRSVRVGYRGMRGTRGQTSRTPIIWDQPGSTQQHMSPQLQRIRESSSMMPVMRDPQEMQMQPRGGIYSTLRGGPRGRRPGRGRPPKGFSHPYNPNPRY